MLEDPLVASPFITFENEEDRYLLEGPRLVTIEGRHALVWINIQASESATHGAIHARFFDDGEQRKWQLHGRPGFVLPTDRPGVLFLGMDKEIGLFHLDSHAFHPLATIPDDNPRTIINDAEVVPGGNAIVFGTKDVKFENPIAHLYLFTLEDGRLTVLADQQTCSNGKVFVPNEGGWWLYDIDTPTRMVKRYRFDLATRTVEPHGMAVDFREGTGFPDGMCDVGDGTVIIALYTPMAVPHGRVIRARLDTGEWLEQWITPGAPRVTCPLLVPTPDGVKLVLTSATEGMSKKALEECPRSGFVLMADTRLSRCPTGEAVRLPPGM